MVLNGECATRGFECAMRDLLFVPVFCLICQPLTTHQQPAGVAFER